MNRFDANPESARCWREVSDILEVSPSQHVADFMRSFYTNADPKIPLMRKIACPTLLIVGEYDEMFIKPNELLARIIPDARHVVMPALGHMTAIEDPPGLTAELLTFLSSITE